MSVVPLHTPRWIPDVEEWRPVQANTDYQVSSHGRVRNKKGLILKPILTKPGYYNVGLWRHSKSQVVRVHKIVAEAFLGPRPEGLVVMHLDNDPANNRLSNLRYGTQSENIQQSVRDGNHHEARKTHCPKGHEYSPDNTSLLRKTDRKPGSYSRRCLTCHREDMAARKARASQ